MHWAPLRSPATIGPDVTAHAPNQPHKQEGPAYMARPFHISLRQLPIHARTHTHTLLDHFMPAASKLATKAKHAG